jgi:hypothetical protein
MIDTSEEFGLLNPGGQGGYYIGWAVKIIAGKLSVQTLMKEAEYLFHPFFHSFELYHMALGLTETLTEISIRNSFWGER